MLELDHVAVAAETLEEGRAHVEDTLGVALQPGGQHAHFGTHNALLGLEGGLYLEVITTDPDAPIPASPRWFDLDRFAGVPRITNWICRTNNLVATVEKHKGAGQPVNLQRGDLKWCMAVPDNGILPYDGAFPALIEWGGTAHPATTLVPSGCRLERLTIYHSEAQSLRASLSADISDTRVVFATGPNRFCAEFATPHGRRVLT